MREQATILARILTAKQAEIERLRNRKRKLARRAAGAPSPRGFEATLREAPELAVIAEFKRRSPSRGVIDGEADPAAVADAYERGGASALSILTDGPAFGGSLADLQAARAACSLPVLRKDFLLDPLQLLESRAAGADAVLLLARALPEERLVELLRLCDELGLAALVEAHEAGEVARAVGAGARVVGVNARELASFEVDLDRALELLGEIPEDRVAVAESGVCGGADAAAAGRAGADAILVGSWLMVGDPERRLAELVGRPRGRRRLAARPDG